MTPERLAQIVEALEGRERAEVYAHQITLGRNRGFTVALGDLRLSAADLVQALGAMVCVDGRLQRQ